MTKFITIIIPILLIVAGVITIALAKEELGFVVGINVTFLGIFAMAYSPGIYPWEWDS